MAIPAIKGGVACIGGIVILSKPAKSPRQVAPSPPRYACHLSRFNGRVYTWKGKTVGLNITIIYAPPNTTLPGDVSLTLNMTVNKHVIASMPS